MAKAIFFGGGVAIILVIGVIVAIVAVAGRGTIDNNGGLSGARAVDTLCANADFKDLCVETLSPAAKKNDKASPKDLTQASFQATFEEAKKALNLSQSLNKDLKSPYDKMTMDDCQENLQYAVDDLDAANSRIAGQDLDEMNKILPDLNNYLSAVLSYKASCMDDIKNPELKKAMGDGLENTTRQTYNALGVIDGVGKILPKDHLSRRLMNEVGKDGHPQWFSAADRKLLASEEVKPNAVVALDGSGQFKSIQDAVNAYPKGNQGRYVIYVKAGVYKENVHIPKKTIDVFMYGDGATETIVAGDRNYALQNFTTQDSATFAALGNGFIAKSMGFNNTSGPEGHQAVALRVQSDYSAFYNCTMEGFQDTLYIQSNRQFYRDCSIHGTVDFIFGRGAAVIQNSKVIVRMPKPDQSNTVTANGRQHSLSNAITVIQNCQIVADPQLIPQKLQITSYLGRPWSQNSMTMVMESEIGDFISPEGWTPWNQTTTNQDTCEYKEYANRGPGANTSGRVRWKGFEIVNDKKVAQRYTAGPALQGDQWLQNTGAPFYLGFAQ